MVSQRRKFLIDPQFQLSIVAHTCLSSVIAIVLFYSANQYFFWKFQKKGEALSLPADHIFFKFLYEQKTTMDTIFIGMTALVFIFHFIYGVYLSNKIAGPIYRIKKFIENHATGNPDSLLSLREGDYFRDLAQDVTQLAKKVSEPSK